MYWHIMSQHWCFLGTAALKKFFFPLFLWCFLLKGLQQSQLLIYIPHGFFAACRGCITAMDVLAGRKGRLCKGDTFHCRTGGKWRDSQKGKMWKICGLVELEGLEGSVPSHRTGAFMSTVMCWKTPAKERSALPCALEVLGFGETKGAF